MIRLRTRDFNMTKVVSSRVRRDFDPEFEVLLYGIKDDPTRPEIEILTMDDVLPENAEVLVNQLQMAGLEVSVEVCDEREREYDGLRIGIHWQVRNNIRFCRRLVKTILAGLSGQLDYNSQLSIKRVVSKEKANV